MKKEDRKDSGTAELTWMASRRAERSGEVTATLLKCCFPSYTRAASI